LRVIVLSGVVHSDEDALRERQYVYSRE
jgi:hypothetical protein